ncbi:uncharacterized protein LOC115227921 [Octopus sinensis]|uniref:Uncharacterized protein LOC115227921 n=1 Tax=Octopus sinensis TaxID=2607531 RepID=A0A6P7U0I8_9MOLL|nr:uncharacterized protein LOC115227921 [Octopus sinensis]
MIGLKQSVDAFRSKLRNFRVFEEPFKAVIDLEKSKIKKEHNIGRIFGIANEIEKLNQLFETAEASENQIENSFIKITQTEDKSDKLVQSHLNDLTRQMDKQFHKINNIKKLAREITEKLSENDFLLKKAEDLEKRFEIFREKIKDIERHFTEGELTIEKILTLTDQFGQNKQRIVEKHKKWEFLREKFKTDKKRSNKIEEAYQLIAQFSDELDQCKSKIEQLQTKAKNISHKPLSCLPEVISSSQVC